mmetsp:Transcript_22466/g.35296  ORF Transcript_22466/g.35296 Transcript_22466/m.35296 type:complete len:273 (+) Transcript_22466:1181-1999(+)
MSSSSLPRSVPLPSSRSRRALSLRAWASGSKSPSSSSESSPSSSSPSSPSRLASAPTAPAAGSSAASTVSFLVPRKASSGAYSSRMIPLNTRSFPSPPPPPRPLPPPPPFSETVQSKFLVAAMPWPLYRWKLTVCTSEKGTMTVGLWMNTKFFSMGYSRPSEALSAHLRQGRSWALRNLPGTYTFLPMRCLAARATRLHSGPLIRGCSSPANRSWHASSERFSASSSSSSVSCSTRFSYRCCPWRTGRVSAKTKACRYWSGSRSRKSLATSP